MLFICLTLGKRGSGFSDFVCTNKQEFGSSLDSKGRSSTTFSKHFLFQLPSFTRALHPNWALAGAVTSQIRSCIHQLRKRINVMLLAVGLVSFSPQKPQVYIGN